jgi:hypothetical protein
MGKFDVEHKGNKVVLTRRTAGSEKPKAAEKADATPVSEPLDKPRDRKAAEKQ